MLSPDLRLPMEVLKGDDSSLINEDDHSGGHGGKSNQLYKLPPQDSLVPQNRHVNKADTFATCKDDSTELKKVSCKAASGGIVEEQKKLIMIDTTDGHQR